MEHLLKSTTENRKKRKENEGKRKEEGRERKGEMRKRRKNTKKKNTYKYEYESERKLATNYQIIIKFKK